MRLMISGGGTGGHVYPALAVLPAFKSPPEVLWVGSQGGLERGLVERAGLKFAGIAAAGLRGKNPWAAVQGLVALSQGYGQSRQILRQFAPDVLFVTGGYVCAPVAVAAHRAKIPILIYLPDIQPGQAIKFLSRYATKVAITAPPAAEFFPAGLTVTTGYPVRASFYQASRPAAHHHLGLEPTLPTVLVLGGSQGARSLNQALAQQPALSNLLAAGQIIHLSGRLDAEWTEAERAKLPASLQKRYYLRAYMHEEMVDAFAAADVIVCRAGASVLGEVPAVGTPAILVPYPYSGAHQWPNARYLAEAGAAVTLPDAEVGEKLAPTILNLLNNPDQRQAMSVAARRLARPNAALAIATELVNLSGGHP